MKLSQRLGTLALSLLTPLIPQISFAATETITGIYSNSHALIKINQSRTDGFSIGGGSAYISAFVRNHVLYIRDTSGNESSHFGAVVNVNVHQLHSLYAYHATRVQSDNLQTDNLVIDSNNRGNIDLNGAIGLSKVHAMGPGQVQVRWVNSRDLEVLADGNANVRLSGVVKNLRVSLNGSSQFKGQYLRAKNVMVKTRNTATAKVTAIDTLKAFAFENSNIYHYKQPRIINRYNQGSGNILQIDWRE